MKRALACAALLAGCSYDYDTLYENVYVDPDSGVAFGSKALINNWFGHLPLSPECVSCAEQQCAQANTDCMGDPLCVAYTACVGSDPTPAGIANCRARQEFSEWINEAPNVFGRDLSGPYGQCVFRTVCSAACTDDRELWCSGKYTWPNTSATTVPLSLYIIEPTSNQPIADATVRACDAMNPLKCLDTDGTTTKVVGSTDANGLAKLDLPASWSTGFIGYLEITRPGNIPTLLKFGWKLSQTTTQIVQIVPEAFYGAAVDANGTTPDRSLGMLQMRFYGCQGGGVKGVRFKLRDPDPRSRPWYLDARANLGASETASLGQGGIINVPEGLVYFSALAADESVLVGFEAPVRNGFMTVVIIAPPSE